MILNYDPNANRNQHNYFTSMEKRFQDEYFVWHLKPEQIQRSAKERIFREMVKGQIDYSMFGKYYEDPKFLENLLVAARDELNNNTTIRNALAFQDTYQPGIADVVSLRGKYEALTYIFSIIVQRLEAVKQSGNIGYLTDLHFVLGAYRNQL